MHRCQQFLFPFARCLNKSGHYQPSGFAAEAAVTCINITGKKSPRKRFIFVKDWHMFPKIIQDSLSKHFAAVLSSIRVVTALTKLNIVLGSILWGCLHWHVQGELAKRLFFPKPQGACRAWVVCRAGVKWLPAQCHTVGRMWHLRPPARWDVANSCLSTNLYFNKAHSRQY